MPIRRANGDLARSLPPRHVHTHKWTPSLIDRFLHFLNVVVRHHDVVVVVFQRGF
jgi:hypothetical protein